MMHPQADHLRIVIAIPSYRRAECLARCLDSISALTGPFEDRDICVLVVDNDAQTQEALQVVERMAAGFRFALIGLLVETRGISQVRNAILDYGFHNQGADFIAMVDDNQWLESDWLAQMMAVQASHQVDVVGCRVVADFMGAAPSSLHGHPIYRRSSPQTGRIARLEGTCGILIKNPKGLPHETLRFDTSFSLTGGGDTDFFLHLERQGGKAAFCAEAIAHECYTANRQTVAWVRLRCERLGMTDTILRLRHATRAKAYSGIALRIILAMGKGTIYTTVYAWHPLKREIGISSFYRVKGRLRALTGRLFEMYR